MPTPRAKIFVCYRRRDAEFLVSQLADFVEGYFGEGSVFRDIDDTPLASDFEAILDENLAQAEVLLVVITEHWLGQDAVTGERRIDNPNDYVRHEVRFALQRNIPILPFVVHPAKMPSRQELPADISELYRRQALECFPGPSFRISLLALVEGLFDILPHADRRKIRRAALEDTQVIRGRRAQQEALQRQRQRALMLRRLGWSITACAMLGLLLSLAFFIFGKRPESQPVGSTPEATQRQRTIETWTAADQLRLSKEIASLKARVPKPGKARLAKHSMEASLGTPDYSAFEILSDDRYWDLRGWKKLDANSEPLQSYIILTRRVRLLKVADAQEIRFEAKTDGTELFLECLSHPMVSEELVSNSPSFVGERPTKLRQLGVDVSQVPVGSELTVEYKATYWDSLQNDDDRWLGAIGYPRADRLRVYVLMPTAFPLKSYKLRIAPSFREQTREYDGPIRVLEGDDHSSLLWEVPTPEGNWVYTLLLEW